MIVVICDRHHRRQLTATSSSIPFANQLDHQPTLFPQQHCCNHRCSHLLIQLLLPPVLLGLMCQISVLDKQQQLQRILLMLMSINAKKWHSSNNAELMQLQKLKQQSENGEQCSKQEERKLNWRELSHSGELALVGVAIIFVAFFSSPSWQHFVAVSN